MKIGIIGGSFDPIHFGHLIMAEILREKANLNKIVFIPTGKAPHKLYQTDAKIRQHMVELATVDNENFIVCDIEVKKETVSYTYETLSQLKSSYPECEFYFIIGLDILFDIENWHKAKELGTVTNFLLVNRLGYFDMDIEEIKSKAVMLKDNLGLNIELVESPIIEISSSMIRNRVKHDLSIKYLTTKDVVNYIEANRLYK